MKKQEIIIYGADDKNGLINAINQYFKSPSQKTMVNLIICLLKNKLYETGNSSIKFTVDKFSYLGGYNNGLISLNAKLLKSAKKTENFPAIIKTIFHEYCHFLIDLNNIAIVKTNGDYNKFFPFYIQKNINHIYKEVFNDLEMETYAHIIFYIANKNEYFARKYGHKNMCEFLEKYVNNIQFNIKSFEEEEKEFQLSNYKCIPELKYYKQIIISEINKYQQKLITQGLQFITVEQRYHLINSYTLTATKENINLLINAINSCEDNKIRESFLKNPVVRMIKNNLYNQNQSQKTKN